MMGISGSRTAAQGLPTDINRNISDRPGSYRFIRFWLIVLSTAASLSAGCMTIRYGWQPQVDRLATLQPGISTPRQVLMTLGEPRGYGIVRYTQDMTPRKIWFYEYLEVTGKDVKIKFLLVLFDRDLYDGYLWFFSGSRTETEWFVIPPKEASSMMRPQANGGNEL